MYVFDAQWQGEQEVSLRMAGLYRGLNTRWPDTIKLALGPSSCQPRRPFSVYMGRSTRHNVFRNMENATALAPLARVAAENQSVLFLDTRASKLSFTPTRLTPCHYDLPLGPMAEALVQVALNGLYRGGARRA